MIFLLFGLKASSLSLNSLVLPAESPKQDVQYPGPVLRDCQPDRYVRQVAHSQGLS